MITIIQQISSEGRSNKIDEIHSPIPILEYELLSQWMTLSIQCTLHTPSPCINISYCTMIS